MACNKNFAVLVVLAMTATLGILMLFVGCAVRFEKRDDDSIVNWWAIFVLIFYVLGPLPLTLSRCCMVKEAAAAESLSLLSDMCYFVSACIVVSAFALPLILARQSVIEYGAFGVVGGANVFVFSTLFWFVHYFIREEEFEW